MKLLWPSEGFRDNVTVTGPLLALVWTFWKGANVEKRDLFLLTAISSYSRAELLVIKPNCLERSEK